MSCSKVCGAAACGSGGQQGLVRGQLLRRKPPAGQSPTLLGVDQWRQKEPGRQLPYRMLIFTASVLKHWGRLPGEVVQSPSSRMVRTQLVPYFASWRSPLRCGLGWPVLAVRNMVSGVLQVGCFSSVQVRCEAAFVPN